MSGCKTHRFTDEHGAMLRDLVSAKIDALRKDTRVPTTEFSRWCTLHAVLIGMAPQQPAEPEAQA